SAAPSPLTSPGTGSPTPRPPAPKRPRSSTSACPAAVSGEQGNLPAADRQEKPLAAQLAQSCSENSRRYLSRTLVNRARAILTCSLSAPAPMCAHTAPLVLTCGSSCSLASTPSILRPLPRGLRAGSGQPPDRVRLFQDADAGFHAHRPVAGGPEALGAPGRPAQRPARPVVQSTRSPTAATSDVTSPVASREWRTL